LAQVVEKWHNELVGGWLQGVVGCLLRTIFDKFFLLGISPTKWWVTFGSNWDVIYRMVGEAT